MGDKSGIKTAEAEMKPKGLDALQKEVIEAGLCIYCGACLGHCPYFRKYKGRVVVTDSCDLSCPECYKYCPRTPTDWDKLNQSIFGTPYPIEELGTVREVYLGRSANSQIHRKGQDGGVITTLLAAAMEEGLIDAAAVTRMDDDKTPGGFIARTREELIACAGNSYEAGFSLEALNGLPKDSADKLGVVGIPCQVEAVAKMKADPPEEKVNIDNVKLVLGLFCGWAMLPHKFHQFLAENVNLKQVIKFDIPHHPDDSFDIYTMNGVTQIKLDKVRPYVNPACSYCADMTAEFADISVGSGRRIFGWNTVIVRSERGKKLLDKAVEKKQIELAPLPDNSLQNLKRASLNKKKRALSNIIEKSGSRDNLLYFTGPMTGKKEFISLLP